MTSVLVLDTDFPDLEVERQVAAAHALDVTLADPLGVVGAGSDVAALVTMWTPVDQQTLDSVPGIKVVGRIGLGVDAIDVPAATERGIAVVNSGDYATEEVTHHTVGLLLALVRQIAAQDRWVRSGGWLHRKAMGRMRRLTSMKAGVVGLGHIGCRVAETLAALGMEVVGFDPGSPPCSVRTVGSLEELLSEADVALLHVPLTGGTRGLIGRDQLALMRPGSLLINTSRGAIVDQQALVDALTDGTIAGAGLDVFEPEPLSDHALSDLEQVVLTPHVAYYSPESLVEARTRTMEGIAAVLEGRRPPNQLN